MLFTAAVLGNIGRIIIRLRYQKRLFIDDYFLLFGCSTLIAAFAITNVMFEGMYYEMSLLLGPIEFLLQESSSAGFEDHARYLEQLCYSTEVFCWVTIFAVKLSFLLFFRQLVDRLKIQLMYWRVTMCIVIISGIFCVCSIFISCPHLGASWGEHLDIYAIFDFTLIDDAQMDVPKEQGFGGRSSSRSSTTP